MLNDSQEQNVDGGSMAVQAGRDVHIHGLSVSDVRELCVLFLRDNFPKLQEDARRTAEDRVKEFATQLEAKIVNNLSSVVVEKFSDPDVQATINDAVQASARKGAAANPDLLANLILEKVSSDSSEFRDMVFGEAVKIVPRLTREQIAFLSFAMSVQHMALSANTAESLEWHCQRVLAYSEPSFGLSDPQREYIHYTGAASVLDKNALHAKFDIYENVGASYTKLGLGHFRTAIQTQVPSMARLLSQYDTDKMHLVTLTSVGKAIALANISNHIAHINYAIWLN